MATESDFERLLRTAKTRAHTGSFTDALSAGAVGERLALDLYRALGYQVVLTARNRPLSGNGAPQLYLPGGKQATLPDLLCLRDGQYVFVDVKLKFDVSWHRLSGRWQTGINANHLENYASLDSLVTFIHADYTPQDGGNPDTVPYGVFTASAPYLARNVHHQYGGMSYWDVGKLTPLATMDTLCAVWIAAQDGNPITIDATEEGRKLRAQLPHIYARRYGKQRA